MNKWDVHNLPCWGHLDGRMVRDTIDTVICVEVFVESDLEEGCTSLSGSDGGPGEEEDPDAVPAITIGLNDLVLVRYPVLVPAPDGGRVVNAENVNILDLETVVFQLNIVRIGCMEQCDNIPVQ